MALNDADTYYSFDDADNTGSNPDDVSGNGHDGANTGATISSTGVVNEGYFLNGATAFLDVYDIDLGSGGFFFNIWFDWDGSQTDNEILWRADGAGRTIQILINSTGVYRWNVVGSAGSFDRTTSTNVGTVYEMVTMTRVGDVFTLYVDGTQIDTITTALGTINTGNTVRIGAVPISGAAKAGGFIDEFGLWKRDIVAGELATLYNSGSGFNPYAPSGYAKKVLDTVGSKINNVDVINIAKFNDV